MTCIAGLIDGNTIYMGGDSAATGWNHSLMVISDSKVVQNGPFLFGITGSPRLIQLLAHSFKVPDHDPRTDTDKYLCTAFIDALRDCLKSGGYAEKRFDAEEFFGSIMVGYKNCLFTVTGDYQVQRSSLPYMAIGCAFDVALGSLYSTTDIPSEQRILIALSAAEQFSAGVRRPFVVKKLEAAS